MDKITGIIKKVFTPIEGTKQKGNQVYTWLKQEVLISEYGNPSKELLLICWTEIARQIGSGFKEGDLVEVEYEVSTFKSAKPSVNDPKIMEERYFTSASVKAIYPYIRATEENNKTIAELFKRAFEDLDRIINPPEPGEFMADIEPTKPVEYSKNIFFGLKKLIDALKLPKQYLDPIQEKIRAIEKNITTESGTEPVAF